MPLEQVAEFQVFAEHVEALVAAEALELGCVRAVSIWLGECVFGFSDALSRLRIALPV